MFLLPLLSHPCLCLQAVSVFHSLHVPNQKLLGTPWAARLVSLTPSLWWALGLPGAAGGRGRGEGGGGQCLA